MIKDITLGQFFPGDSVIHKADARVKVILCIFYIVMIFFAKSAASYLFLILSSVTFILMSHIPFKTVLRSFRALIFIIVFTSVINLFWTKGEVLWVHLGAIKIYREGVIQAVKMVVRLACLLCTSGVILSYTTSPIALTDALERLLSPLKKIRVPVHEFSMMMTIALRFIPTLVEETDKIMSAQKARGADFSSGGIIARVKSLVPVLIPLFVSAFRRADELAVAMECRCYHGGKGRTRMTEMHLKPMDFALIALFIASGAGIILLNYIHLSLYIPI
ncbi:MAG: energy-coupling factor transporter transmembrane component T [Clostridia bacterium]|nr:energy-coupling factor transporter transmembrane component T [Clostridia bacterium]